MWYVVITDDDRHEFDKFAEAESFYNERLRQEYIEYEKWNNGETWEEYKRALTLVLLRVEQLMPIL